MREVLVTYIIDVGPNRRPVHCYYRPSSQELNLLFVLAEAAGTTVHPDELCRRLKVSESSLRMTASNLRRKLSGEWIVNTVNTRGLRLLYAPYQTDEPGDQIAQDAKTICLYKQEDAFQKGLRTPSESTRALLSNSLSGRRIYNKDGSWPVKIKISKYVRNRHRRHTLGTSTAG